jgi:hypothetical protein
MHGFDENGNFPLSLDINIFAKNNDVKFRVLERHIHLKDYYVTSILVDTSNVRCGKGINSNIEVAWKYRLKSTQDKISATSDISYGISGESKPLKNNTLYTVNIEIQKIKDGKYERQGFGTALFVKKSSGEIILGRLQKDIDKLCQEYY